VRSGGVTLLDIDVPFDRRMCFVEMYVWWKCFFFTYICVCVYWHCINHARHDCASSCFYKELQKCDDVNTTEKVPKNGYTSFVLLYFVRSIELCPCRMLKISFFPVLSNVYENEIKSFFFSSFNFSSLKIKTTKNKPNCWQRTEKIDEICARRHQYNNVSKYSGVIRNFLW
jgi:hypothetical protein